MFNISNFKYKVFSKNNLENIITKEELNKADNIILNSNDIKLTYMDVSSMNTRYYILALIQPEDEIKVLKEVKKEYVNKYLKSYRKYIRHKYKINPAVNFLTDNILQR